MNSQLSLRTIMAEVFECTPGEIDERAEINSVSGWDSLNHVRLMMRLADEGVNVSPGDIGELTSFLAIKKYVEASGRNLHD